MQISDVKNKKTDYVISKIDFIENILKLVVIIIEAIHKLKREGSDIEVLHINYEDRLGLKRSVYRYLYSQKGTNYEDNEVEKFLGLDVQISEGIKKGVFYIVSDLYEKYKDNRFLQKVEIIDG